MQFKTNYLADLILHCFVYLDTGNDADLFDCGYHQKYNQFLKEDRTEILIGKMQKVKECYDADSDKYATIQFFPFLYPTWPEFQKVANQYYGKDDPFVQQLNCVAKEEEKKYPLFWQEEIKSGLNSRLDLENYLEPLLRPIGLFQPVLSNLQVNLMVSLTRAGRMMKTKEGYLIAIGNHLKKQEAFFQLLHECSHTCTDPMMKGTIRFADTTHAQAEGGSLLLGYRIIEKTANSMLDEYCQFFHLPNNFRQIAQCYSVQVEIVDAIKNLTI